MLVHDLRVLAHRLRSHFQLVVVRMGLPFHVPHDLLGALQQVFQLHGIYGLEQMQVR
jgi:hypothetical protein